MKSSARAADEPAYVTTEHERQRVAHLVLGQARPTEKVTKGKRAGRRKPVVRQVPVVLEPSIETAMQLRERWSHKRHATPETLEYATSPDRAGALARLHAAETINKDQLAAAEAIATVYVSIGRDVAVTTASFEARVSGGGDFHALFFEKLGSVWREMAYTRWRAALGSMAPAVLDIIVNDVGLTIVARRYRMHNRRMRKLLVDALDLWPKICSQQRREADQSALIDGYAGMMG